MKNRKKITVVLGIITAILLGMLLLFAHGYSPVQAYSSILQYSVFSTIGQANTINRFVFLLLAGASAAIALGVNVSNLGQFGQILMGVMSSTLVGIYVKLPSILLIPLMMIVGMAAGSLWAGVAAMGKKFFGMNEFIITLMLNFIADYFVRYLIATPLRDPAANWPASRIVSDRAILPLIGKIDSSVFIVIAAYMLAVFFVKKTRTGYEFRIMGTNCLFAKVGGCDTDKNFMKAMLFSGALAGLLGAMLIAGATQQHRVITALGENFANDGLMISIVAGNNIAGIFIYAILFSIIQSGATGMQLDTGVPSEFTTMLIAIIVLSVVAFRSYSGIFIDKLVAKKKTKSLEVSR